MKTLKFNIFSKIIIIALFTISILALVSAQILQGIANEVFYAGIKVNVTKRFPDNPQKVECIMKNYRAMDLAGNVLVTDLVVDPDKINDKLQYHIMISELSCDFIIFINNAGIYEFVLIILIIIMIIAIIVVTCCNFCSCLKKICL